VKVRENGWVKVREKLPAQVVGRSWKITTGSPIKPTSYILKHSSYHELPQVWLPRHTLALCPQNAPNIRALNETLWAYQRARLSEKLFAQQW